MKNKVVVPLAIFVAICLIIAGVLAVVSVKGLGFSEGLYLRTDSGSDMVIMGSSPIVMSNRRGNIDFSKLTSGDKILLLHDGIQASYPGGTGAYLCIKLKDGEFTDIPEDVIVSLTEMGWMK